MCLDSGDCLTGDSEDLLLLFWSPLESEGCLMCYVPWKRKR